MIIINLRLTLLFILATFTYSVQSDEFDDQTTYTQYRYFSTAIPEDIRRFIFYVDYCFVDLAFDIETDSMTAKNDIINECTPLKERNKTLKEKYKKNEEIIAILSIADDTILIYEELKK
ncbi:hypothetical protein C5O94_24540 [Escherichia coli]|uniref:hypothetical protein n=1 Tax=Escherichia coli TaxID=562 RepID=UPI000CF179CE|nr:hypothetical protein [Escherichia coli]PPV82796.1 hypothetical protein C5O94_24540 [Escherichia coli]